MIKELNVLKKKNAVQTTWQKVAESLDFEENDSFIRASSN